MHVPSWCDSVHAISVSRDGKCLLRWSPRENRNPRRMLKPSVPNPHTPSLRDIIVSKFIEKQECGATLSSWSADANMSASDGIYEKIEKKSVWDIHLKLVNNMMSKIQQKHTQHTQKHKRTHKNIQYHTRSIARTNYGHTRCTIPSQHIVIIMTHLKVGGDIQGSVQDASKTGSSPDHHKI